MGDRETPLRSPLRPTEMALLMLLTIAVPAMASIDVASICRPKGDYCHIETGSCCPGLTCKTDVVPTCVPASDVVVSLSAQSKWIEHAVSSDMFTTYQVTGPSSNTDSCYYSDTANKAALDGLSQCWKAAFDQYWQDAKTTKFPIYEPRCTGHETYPGGWIGSQIRRVLGALTGPIEPKATVGEGDCATVCQNTRALKDEFMLKEGLVHSCALKQVN